MKDALLHLAINMAEAESPYETDITLIVGGFLISGFVISAKKYAEHHAIPKLLKDAIERQLAQDPDGQSQPGLFEPNYIHLRDARYFTPGQPPVPGNQGVFCRIELEAVVGFHFGWLQAQQ